ncbi:MAG TPA: radical SAM protein [Anaerolineae bacterium]|nr:radical SAM protein [Anaerolineae bacterium]
MTNLLISAICNRRCACCFTQDRPGLRRRFLSLRGFQERLDLLDRSGLDSVRLLGGEPTLHPRFPELVDRAQRAGKAITVFSNGLMPASALACLAALPHRDCTVVVNVVPPAGRTHQRQRETLRRLGRRALPGLTLDCTGGVPGFVLDLVAETGCRPAVRVSLAHAVLSGRNRYVHPKQYRAVAARVVPLARAAAAAGVRLEFDCGFVRCMFSEPDLQVLQDAGVELGWHCSPILDVDLDGQVYYCLPLAGLLSLHLTPTTQAGSLRAEFEARTRPYRQVGVLAECSTCLFREAGDCAGGCLAAAIRRLRPASFCLTVPRPAEVAP